MIEVCLTRHLPVESYTALMTIGRADDKRRDLLAVLALVRQHGGRVTAEQICHELLMDRPQIVGKKVVDRCADLGLLTRDGELTNEGREASESSVVFIPETGKYRVWATSDPLVPGRFLGIEPVPEVNAPEANQAAKRRWNARENIGRPVGESIDLPDTITSLRRSKLTSFVGLTGRVRILDVEPKGEQLPIEPSLSRCRLEWKISPGRIGSIRLTDGIEAKFEPPQIEFRDLWRQVLGGDARNWVDDETGGWLKTRFSDETLQPAERMSLQRSKQFQPELEGLGEFDPVTVESIPVFPATSSDANAWAEWIQEHSVTEYLDLAGFERLNSRIAARFPGYEVILPDRQVLAKRIANSVRHSDEGRFPPSYWFLRAALDLGDGEELRSEG